MSADAIGTLGGLCNRKACRAPGATWYNHGTRAYYCQPCAFRINDGTPGLCVRVAPSVSKEATRAQD